MLPNVERSEAEYGDRASKRCHRRPSAKEESKKLRNNMDPLNKAFIQLVSKSGWTKAETARRLELTPAVITRYFNGETRPSLTTIKLLKLTLGDTSPLPGRDTDISVG